MPLVVTSNGGCLERSFSRSFGPENDDDDRVMHRVRVILPPRGLVIHMLCFLCVIVMRTLKSGIGMQK